MVTAEQVTIRACEARDLDHFDVFGTGHVQYCRDEFVRNDVVILVAVSGEDVPVGKIHVHLERSDDTASLEAAAVVKPLRSRGIGTSLVDAAEALAVERGYRTAELGVEDSNPGARPLYERLGYIPVARSNFQYVGAPVPNPGVSLRKALT
jgi:ribosomal protein S18 acetylase RimI-like enzyme